VGWGAALVILLLTGVALPSAARGAEAKAKVAIIVGPVGPEITPQYIELAEKAADAAERRGATVARAYAPEATAEKVLAAVENANIVVYFGHGLGAPGPASEPSATANGWGLNGPPLLAAAASVAPITTDGPLSYYGEAWIAAHARPAPGWVMIYSNACYAPGAGQGFEPKADEATAAARVSAYSRAPLGELGASAYFATDFYAGAAHLVAALLDGPQRPYADIFASEPNYQADGVVTLPHAEVDGAVTRLQRSAYFADQTDYWYAFAGDPQATFGGGRRVIAALRAAIPPVPPLAVDGIAVGMASSYPETAGWLGEATVALPLELGGSSPPRHERTVLVCADRCVELPVVDYCPCYARSTDQRVVNLSHAAWELVTDAPLEEGLVPVTVYLHPQAPRMWTRAPSA
jgi:hypothetical protein